MGWSGLRVGPMSFGGAQIGNLRHVVSEAESRSSVSAAWDEGVRYFDVAPHYGLGLAERRLGDALRQRPRDEYILSTKVGRLLEPAGDGVAGLDPEGYAVPATRVRVRDYSRDGVLRSLESSLARLAEDRVDLVFVHDPDDHYREALEGAFPALEDLRSQGVIRSYGAGMNHSRMLADLVRNTDLDVVLLAGRYTLLEQGALDDLLPACEARGVSVIAGGVFNSGLLASRTPASATYNYLPPPAEVLQRVDRIARRCERYGTTLPAAAVQFVLAHPAVATVCLGARNADQVRQNADLFRAGIPDELWIDLVSEGLLRPDAPVPRTGAG
jgi:D-threo-aldose 1-dehydrogenase